MTNGLRALHAGLVRLHARTHARTRFLTQKCVVHIAFIRRQHFREFAPYYVIRTLPLLFMREMENVYCAVRIVSLIKQITFRPYGFSVPWQ